MFGHGGESDDDAFAGTFTPTVPSDINATSDGTPTSLDGILEPQLKDNGGRTRTHALVAGSPALDAGDPTIASPPEYDQRGAGFARVSNGRIDIGAYELQVSAVVGGVTLSPSWMDVAAGRAELLALAALAALGAALLLQRLATQRT